MWQPRAEIREIQITFLHALQRCMNLDAFGHQWTPLRSLTNTRLCCLLDTLDALDTSFSLILKKGL